MSPPEPASPDPADDPEDGRYRQAPRQTVGWYEDCGGPEAMRGQRVFLVIGALDYYGTVWVGGRGAEHEGDTCPSRWT